MSFASMCRSIVTCLLVVCFSNAFALTLNSQHVIVVNDETGQVLVEKDSTASVPIASLTKLITAMVVLDSKPDMNGYITIKEIDVDHLKHSSSHVRVGTVLTRQEALRLALMSSDNRAAAALARTYPGGSNSFISAVHAKINALGMLHTVITEPTGLSPGNVSTAADLAVMAAAAAHYPEIHDMTTNSSEVIQLNGRGVAFHNTNRLVGSKGWDVWLSKTGFTNEAGHCLIMRIRQAGKSATLVLLNAKAVTSSVFDASRIRHLVGHSEDIVRRAR